MTNYEFVACSSPYPTDIIKAVEYVETQLKANNISYDQYGVDLDELRTRLEIDGVDNVNQSLTSAKKLRDVENANFWK